MTAGLRAEDSKEQKPQHVPFVVVLMGMKGCHSEAVKAGGPRFPFKVVHVSATPSDPSSGEQRFITGWITESRGLSLSGADAASAGAPAPRRH